MNKDNKNSELDSTDKKLHISDVSDSYNKDITRSEQNFINAMAEEVFFANWVDESCGNFVGWTKEYKNFSITIHRENTAVGGFYHFAKMNKGYRSHYDYKSNLIEEKKSLSLLKINDILSVLDEI